MHLRHLGFLLLVILVSACDSQSMSESDRDVRGLWDHVDYSNLHRMLITDSTLTDFYAFPQLECILPATLDIIRLDDQVITLDGSVEIHDPFTGEITTVGEDFDLHYSFSSDTLIIDHEIIGDTIKFIPSTTDLESIQPICSDSTAQRL